MLRNALRAEKRTSETLSSTVTAMSDALSFPVDIVYSDAGEGWVMASIPQLPGAFSQGRTRDEARENVRDALRELLLARAQESPDDTLTLTIAP